MKPGHLFMALLGICLATRASRADTPMLGGLSNEPRTSDNRIDVPKTIDALQKLNANTFYYLIMENEHDWDDLPAFADAAARHNIAVWPYLVPWSETPPHKKGGKFSEPYRNDYVLWAMQIARLSLSHPNIEGFVIDDFYGNTLEADHFSTNYVREMTDSAKHINPKIKFYPLMYFQDPWAEFLNSYAGLIDGVVIAYPRSEAEARNALNYLNDRVHGPTVILQLPRKDGAHAGDFAMASCEVAVNDPPNAELSFYFDSTDSIQNPCDAVARVRLNGRIVWEVQTRQPDRRDGVVHLEVFRQFRPGQRVRLDFELRATRTGVPEAMPIVARFDDIRMYAMGSRDSQYATGVQWRLTAIDRFKAQIVGPSKRSGRFKLPGVLMPAGESEQFEKRYDLPPTAQNVALKFRMCGDLVQQGLAQGIVGYRIPLQSDDPNFLAIAQEYARLRELGNN
jgi:hypothetical protein